jgi:catechol 2,3-dioxygenase-like lactoylglutathione lyase family enzyme
MHPHAISFVTLVVPDLEAALNFYVGVLDFRISRRFDQTRWVSLDIDESRGGLGLIEPPKNRRADGLVYLDLFVADLDRYWSVIRHKVSVASAPQLMQWGSYKAVIHDVFGNHIGFVQAAHCSEAVTNASASAARARGE